MEHEINESNSQDAVPQGDQTETSKPLTLLQRTIGVFSSPQKTFADIATHPNWVFPFIVIILITMLATQILVPAIIADFKSSEQYEKLMQDERLTTEQIEKAQEMQIGYMKNFAGISSGIATAIMSLLAAAVLLFIGNIIMGGNAKFGQIFAIYCWGGLVGVLSAIVRLPISLQQLSMKVYFGPALLFPVGAEETAALKIAGALDIFTIWRLILLAVGFSAIYRFSFGKSIVTLGLLYGLSVAVTIILSGLF